eukprot:CAMPEP_0116936534 /NCGR_PEP_ID=MMETSP0467-20121206/30951_1 /TAXON_ID=283647 /ORGANISM="Mesodinium pulex, Strain SPMC105" /LENGTH=72 /DNA_ID=CAMNT_0004618147 /DNA_START=302 /DNA_END=520 /DNA_ORIENTATION=+
MDFISQTYNLMAIFYNNFGLVVLFDLDSTLLKYLFKQSFINEIRTSLNQVLFKKYMLQESTKSELLLNKNIH